LISLAAMPLAWRLFAFLPDRGYAFAKAVGLLGVGYLLWLGATFGVLRNSAGGVLLSLILFAVVGLWLGRAGLRPNEEGKRPLLMHLRQQRAYILVAEVLFLLAFAAWAYFRAYNPDIAGTEKPMEFAFLNGILNSSHFPPRDVWLSGYGISYYYFGYVILNTLVLLTGVASSVAFNLGLAMVFALTLLGAFGLAYNLVTGDETTPAGKVRGWLYGMLGALFVGILGNLEGVLEALHARGWMSPTMHAFFDVKELATAPVTGSWNLASGYWWWWRASRTIHDYDFSRSFDQEVIDEFPMFSFLLGDMHPHVLAIPFVLLAIALALNIFRRPIAPALPEPVTADENPVESEQESEPNRWSGLHDAWSTVCSAFGFGGWGIVIYGIALGALSFLNTTDFPIYLFLLTLAYALRRGFDGLSVGRRLVQEVVLAFIGLLLIGVIAYLPFYLGFSSQVSGFLPNVYNPTRFVQYFLMFGPFLVLLAFMLVVAYRRTDVGKKALGKWLLWTLLLPALFLALTIVAALLLPGARSFSEQVLKAPAAEIIPRILSIRLAAPFTWLIVGLLLATIGALASRAWFKLERRPDRQLIFVLAMFFTALLLTYGVEFVYIRDTFGTRMNTIFKFYYQAWIMMAVASAYALYYINTRAGAALRVVAQILTVILVLGGLIYPMFAIPSKANGFQGNPSLDGSRFVENYRPDEAAVIDWLVKNTPPDAVIVEAPGGSYTDFNTISAHSGRAALLGWGGHELQWRGSYELPGQREPVIEMIYQNQDPTGIHQAVRDYDIDYLIVGPRELSKYSIAPNRQNAFLGLWAPVFQQGEYTIYLWQGG